MLADGASVHCFRKYSTLATQETEPLDALCLMHEHVYTLTDVERARSQNILGISL